MNRCFILSLAAASAVLASCDLVESPLPSPPGGTCEVTFSFRCEEPVSARSGAFQYTTSEIEDVNYYIWDRGRCIARGYAGSGGSSIRQTVSAGGEYTVYALANAGREVVPSASGWEADESSMRDIAVGRGDRTWTAFPMSGAVGPVTFRAGAQSVTVTLRRLAARIGFRFAPDLMLSGQGIAVTAVRLCNAAADVRPFVDASAATSVLPVDDTASADDLRLVAGGGTAWFYAFENCRGTLLRGNDDPWGKVPDNIGGEAALCTYLEVDCTMSGEGVIGGDVTYRFYPGEDNTSNFDVRRNSSYVICLCATGDGLGRLSWKVEADVDYMNSSRLASLRKDRGLHPIQSTYLGEMFECSLTSIDPSVVAFFGGSLAELRANSVLRCFADDGGDDLIWFGTGTVGASAITGIEGTAMRAGTGSVWLCTGDGGKAVPLLQGVTVNKPMPVLSRDPSGEYPEALDGPPVASINAVPEVLHLYLCDSDGLNLMADVYDQYFFSDRPYDFIGGLSLGDYSDCVQGGYVEAGFSCSYAYSEDRDDVVGQPFMSFEYGITISDRVSGQGEWDMRGVGTLVDACFASSAPFRLTLDDTRQGLSASAAAAVTYQPIEVCYLNEHGELQLTNPSHIPLTVSAYEFTFGDYLQDAAKLPEFGVAYGIPSAASPSLTSATITLYAAVGYCQPRLYTSPVRSFPVNPGSQYVMVGTAGWLVTWDAMYFRGYDLMGLVNTYYAASAEPSSVTGIALDIMAAGRAGNHRLGDLSVSPEQEYPYSYGASFAGTAIFSDGYFVSSDISGCTPSTLCCTALNGIVYSPSTMSSLLSGNAELTTGVSESVSASGTNTNYLTVTLKNAKPTSMSLTLSLYGEVTVYPKGTSRGSVTHLVGPDANAVDARLNSGSTVSSEYYRTVPALRSTYSLSLSGTGTSTAYPVPLKSQVTGSVFSQTETDAYTKLNASDVFQHQYHPVDYRMGMEISARDIQDIYKGTFSNRGYAGSTSPSMKTGCLFLDECHYWNPGYLWNKNDESSTTWTFGCHKLDCDGIGYVCLVK